MSADVLDLQITDSATGIDESAHQEFAPVGPVICYRDPADVRTIRRQSSLMILCFAITAVAIVGVVYKSIQALASNDLLCADHSQRNHSFRSTSSFLSCIVPFVDRVNIMRSRP